MSSNENATAAKAARRQSEENLARINSHVEFRGTGSLMDLDTCTRSLADNSFVLEPSAFTLPHMAHRLFIPDQEGTHSLPLPRGNTTDQTNRPSANTTNEKPTELLRKTHSSISLTSIPDGPYGDIWAGSITLRRTAKPNLENERHRENSLRLSILEARNLPSKRRYYCDICLDRTLYARTTSKVASAGIFWAEDFDLNNLPNVSVMTISLYKEADVSGKELRRFGTARMSAKKMRKSQNQLIGFVTVPMSEISGRNDVQVWLTLQPPVDSTSRDTSLFQLASVGAVPSARNPMDETTRSDMTSLLQPSTSFTSLNGKQTIGSLSANTANTMPQIRIRARYRSVDVLPHRDYWALKAFLLEHSLLLSNWLDTVLPVKTKEEVASSMVGLHECNGTLVKFLTDLVVSEVAELDNDSMAFRSNTMATKAVECFVKLVGSTYLHNLLYRIVQKVLACLTAWEVNPEKLPSCNPLTGSLTVSDTAAFAKSNELELSTRPTPGSLKANQLQLLHYLNVVWRAIQASLPRFPGALIRVFSSFRSAIEPLRGAEFCDNLISGCIFLRLICPALLSPSLFGLVSAFPSEPWCQRNLTLLAKSLQSLANFTAFDDKEPYMRFLNGYVSAQMPAMRAFIRNISNWSTAPGRLDDPDTIEGFRDVVDEGFELANLHLLLTEQFNQADENGKSKQMVDGTTGIATNSPSTTGLPESLTPLLCILNDLSKRMDPTASAGIGTTHSLTRYHAPTAVAACDRALDELDRLHATLPSKNRKGREARTTTDCLTHLVQSNGQVNFNPTDVSSASNMYAYHSSSLTNSVPFYTLHQNPGFHRPSDDRDGTGSVKASAVSLLSADRSFAAGSVLAQPDGPGQLNPNDYDEPYAGMQSDSDREGEARPQPSLNGKMETASNLVPFDPTVDLQIVNGESKSHRLQATAVHVLDEPIYDIVPLSDDSSTDEIVDTNNKFLQRSEPSLPDAPVAKVASQRPSLGCLLTEDRCFKPVRLPSVEDASLDSINSFEESTGAAADVGGNNSRTDRAGLQVERPNNIRLDQANQTSLSPRLMPKQVTTASMVLMTPSSPTKTTESPTVNIRPVQTTIRLDANGTDAGAKTKRSTNAAVSRELAARVRNELHPPENTNNGSKSLMGKNLPVTRTFSDLDSYKETGWTSLTSSSNSLVSVRTAAPPDLNDPVQPYPIPSPEYLQSEVVRLRQQLQLSREDAARAANRLSQQEAELAHLRQMLEHLRTKPHSAVTSASHVAARNPALHATSRARTEVPLQSIKNGSDTGRALAQRKLASDSQLMKTSGPIATSTSTGTTTFEELDDAMAKLEREQTELVREQSRIRARLAATRPVNVSSATHSTAQLKSNPNLVSTQVRSPKLITNNSSSMTVNHLLGIGTSGPHVVGPTNTVRGSVPYGPRVRHGPPPRPRGGNPPRYAY